MRLRLSVFLLSLVLVACEHKPAEDTARPDDPLDLDGDGWERIDDCDDTDPTIHPDAMEICNGLDDDCDGDTDEDVATRWYADTDGDGYGDPSIAQESCERPQNHVPTGTDCDDSDPTAYPGAGEACDGRDNDCDGDVDEDGATYYLDADGDGYGDAGSPLLACYPPTGYVIDAEDCDDTDARIHPGVVEVCDGVDNDCDGDTDEGTTATWYADRDRDGWGDDGATVVSCAAPSGFVSEGGDCDDATTRVYPGAPEFCDGVDNDCDGDVDGDATDYDFYQDADGDGHGDPTVTTYGCNPAEGWVLAGDDCDDTTADTHPGAPELCDSIDNDCDTVVDEEEDLEGPAWYLDADGDGHGGSASTVVACAPPSGYAAAPDDCDDTNPEAFPGGTERCDGADNDCDGTVDESAAVDAPTWYYDADGDGYGGDTSSVACTAPWRYVADGGDCDDADVTRNPGVDELCDGIDNDCDGGLDDATSVDAPTCYLDADADGYGDATVTQVACACPSGWVLDATDCDDTSDARSPAVSETCNAVDDDCDGAVDESDSTDALDWYGDRDGDGYGSVSDILAACIQPSGYVGDSTDCDDTSAAVSPNAFELCDAIDNDCDGTVDEDDALGAPLWYRDADADGYGRATTVTTACTAPSGYVSDATDCDDTRATVSPGTSETCDGLDNDCDGTIDEATAIDAGTWYADADADGWGDDLSFTVACTGPTGSTATVGDCDDTDPAIHPGATETCNGLDDDCDGSLDEGLTFDHWYADTDDDGYGDAGSPSWSCAAPAGHVGDDTDCDDSDGGVYPGAAEHCNGTDDDCDGAVDEAGAVDAPTWYQDIDEDGYGSTSTTVACTQPSGWVATGGDCDDRNVYAYPGATEVCDTVDNDCDGVVDDGVVTRTWYLDGDGDAYGLSSVSVASCARPTGYVEASGDCNDGNASIHPGVTEVCDLVDNDCDGGTDEGFTTTWYQDGDADGYGSTLSTASCTLPSGYTATSGDCDDTNAWNHPGASELCDGVDNDCDGSVDDGVATLTWYRDADVDGWGGTSTTASCSRPSGYVDVAGDCNDANSAINPDVVETCDSVDNDCDGTVDEGVTLTWYHDADGDGYGSSTDTVSTCAPPTGYVSDSTDCDDTCTTCNPGATETCGDGEDNDCDGTVDEGCSTTHCGTISASETWSASTTHYVSCSVYVQGSASPTLTIQDGAHVVFAEGTGLYVGSYSYGSLKVTGSSRGVTFSSVGAGEPGSWLGLYIGAFDRGSTLDGLTLEYGGGNGYGGIQLNGASPTISDSIIRYNDVNGVYVSGGEPYVFNTEISDNAGNGWSGAGGGLNASSSYRFDGNVITGNTGYAMSILADYAGQVDDSNSLTGNGEDEVRLASDYVDGTQTWMALDVPWRLTGDVYVQGSASPVLTLEDGAVVEADAGSGLLVGSSANGRLAVNAPLMGVLFTGSDASPAPGDWDGITLGAYDKGSSLLGVTVEYGGGNGYGNLLVNTTSTVSVTEGVFQSSSTAGLYVAAGSPTLADSTFADNVANGVYVASAAGLSTSGSPSFDGNTLTGNGAYALTLPANYVGQVGPDNGMGGNTLDFVQVLADTVDVDATWRALEVPYRVNGHVYVQGTASPQVVLEDGVEVLFDPSTGFYVGSSSYGGLYVDGDTVGVRMSSASAVPAAGDWQGLYTGSYTVAADTTLVGLTVEFGGGNGYGNLWAYGGTYAVTDSTFSDGSYDGIYVTSAVLDISGSTCTSNRGDGIYVSSSGGLSSTSGPTFTTNTLTDNKGYPIELPANYVGQLDDSSTFVGNGIDYVGVLDDTVDMDATWQHLDADYQVEGDVYVQGSARPTLTVAAGARLEFDNDVTLAVGYSDYGALAATGTSSSYVTFTASDPSPSHGDWSGLYLGRYCRSSSTSITYSVVEYGGGNGYGNVLWYACNGTITNSKVQYSEHYGIYRYWALPTISSITYTSNLDGNLR